MTEHARDPVFTGSAWQRRGRRLVADGARHVALIAFSVLLGAAHCVRAQEPATVGASERAVKAAFLYKFPDYIDWPASAFAEAESPFVIGVVGADDLAAELASLVVNRTIDTHPIVVRRLREGESLAGLHVLFVGRAESSRIATLARQAQQRSILTVTESPGALDHGSVINFVLVEGRVRFEIALEAAERSGLKLSSRLLSVAQAVRPLP